MRPALITAVILALISVPAIAKPEKNNLAKSVIRAPLKALHAIIKPLLIHHLYAKGDWKMAAHVASEETE